MPFSVEVCHSNYIHSIKGVCEDLGLEIRRADEIFSTSTVYEDIVKEIQEASVVIVDITNKNPNVFYELGMAHLLKQNRTIMITNDSFKELPFDVAHFRIISYENSIGGKVKFDKALKSTLETLLVDDNEVFKYEFDITYNVLSGANRYGDMFSLIGLRKYKGTLNINDRVQSEGVHENGKTTHHSITAKQCFTMLQKVGHVVFDNDIVSLTPKGISFTEYLLDKGLNCGLFNGQVLIEGYRTIMEEIFQDKNNISQ